MTAQAEALRRLSELLPNWVRLGHEYLDGTQQIHVFDDSWARHGGWLLVCTFIPGSEGGGMQFDRSWRDTRVALEQEIEARGWAWWVLRGIEHPYYEARVRAEELNYQVEEADSPVLALSLALIQALKASS